MIMPPGSLACLHIMMKLYEGINPVMNKSIFILHVSVIAAVFLLFAAKQSISGTTEQESAASVAAEHLQGVEQESPTTRARLKLQSAYGLYESGDIAAAGQDLEEANQSLRKAIEEKGIAKEQTRELANEIQALSEQLTSDSEQQQSAILRYWHRSTALVAREMEDIIHRYSALLTTEQTLKPLLDAKMHLFYAKHDLFTNHNAELAEYELGNVIKYLDDAFKTAKPEVKDRIIKIQNGVKALKYGASLSDEAWHSGNVNNALNSAQSKLDEAMKYATPVDRVRIDKVKSELVVLQRDIVKNSAKQHYDSVMYQLVQLINDL